MSDWDKLCAAARDGAAKRIPFGWKHEVTDFADDPCSDQRIAHVLVREFGSVYGQASINFRGYEARNFTAEQLIEHVAWQAEVAAMCLAKLFLDMWSNQVAPPALVWE